jgi:NADH pyrophosphatase NudC (nudix superfamily)
MYKMPVNPKRWNIEIDKQQFDKLKSKERFWQLVALSRAVNALRFVHSTLVRDQDEDDSLERKRTQYNSFFFNCALLYEALLLVQRLGKYHRNIPEFGTLQNLIKDRTATELRNSNLATLRNRLTFHFDESEIGAQLIKMDFEPRFASGDGTQNRNVYNELADLCTLGAFAGFRLDEPEALEKFGKLIRDVADLSIRFMDAAEDFIVAVLKTEGWEIH